MHASSVAKHNILIKEAVLTVIFTAAFVLGANVRIPLFFTPVPITLQTFILFLSIVFLRKVAYRPCALYLLLGWGGAGVFCGGAGPLYLAGPTGGYLAGFLISSLTAPYVFDFCLDKTKPFFAAFVTFAFTMGIVYGLGFFWLVSSYRLSPTAAFSAGIMPFICGDLIKIAAASIIAQRASGRR